MRKLFVYLFWYYFCEKYQRPRPMEEGDDIPEVVSDEIKSSFKRKYLKFFMILPKPKDVVLD